MSLMSILVGSLPLHDSTNSASTSPSTSNNHGDTIAFPRRTKRNSLKLKRSGRLQFISLLSLSSSSRPPSTRKSPPTCTISLESVTVNSTCITTMSDAIVNHLSSSLLNSSSPRAFPAGPSNAIPFPSSSSARDDDVEMPLVSESDPAQRKRARSLRRASRSITSPTATSQPAATAPSSNHTSRRASQPSSEKHQRRRRSSSSSPHRGLTHHNLLSPTAHTTPLLLQASPRPRSNRRFFAGPETAHLRFVAMVRRSIMRGVDNGRFRVLQGCIGSEDSGEFGYGDDGEEREGKWGGVGGCTAMELYKQDAILIDRLGTYLAERGYREPISSPFFRPDGEDEIAALDALQALMPLSPPCQVPVATTSHVVATLLLRHRDRAAMRSRSRMIVDGDEGGSAEQRRSPLAMEVC